jgi:hypothetical protein
MTMRGKLVRVGWNESLGGSFSVTHNLFRPADYQQCRQSKRLPTW